MASDRIWRDRDTKVVILDSSAILMIFEFSIDLEDELRRLVAKYRIIIPKSIFKELELLSNKMDGKKKINAKASLKFIEKYDVEDSNDLDGDSSVLFLAKKHNGIVVTNDRELRKRTKDEKLNIIYLRGKGKLVLE